MSTSTNIPVVFFGQIKLYDTLVLLHTMYKTESDSIFKHRESDLLFSSVCRIVSCGNRDCAKTMTSVFTKTEHSVLIFTSFKEFNAAKILNPNVFTDGRAEHIKLIAVVQAAKSLYEYGMYCIDIEYSNTHKFVLTNLTTKQTIRALLQAKENNNFQHYVSDFDNGLHKVNNYLREVVHRVKQGSFLTPFMTFIYRLPYSTHQKPVKNLFINWLFYSGDDNTIKEALSFLEKHNPVFKLSDRVRNALNNALDLPNLRQYAQAFADLRQDETIRYRDLVKKYHIDTYELNYIVSIVNSETIMLLNEDTGYSITFEEFFNSELE